MVTVVVVEVATAAADVVAAAVVLLGAEEDELGDESELELGSELELALVDVDKVDEPLFVALWLLDDEALEEVETAVSEELTLDEVDDCAKTPPVEVDLTTEVEACEEELPEAALAFPPQFPDVLMLCHEPLVSP